ncbi:thioredoxin family protein [Stenotrophomonas sp.]|uniref:thioredoxin family protein n=1 Tax=Stenotrophomonas sp. TaxID=69392 RepID=UPI00289DA8AA|nr:thioredoxin family protein [Stenotrophomonas sp.]
MSYSRDYVRQEPSRAEIDAGSGWQLVEFGAPWCPHCSAAQLALKEWLGEHEMPHLKIEDGKGRPAGRSFKVKLWPTVILLRDGQEVARVVRPRGEGDLAVFGSALQG